MGSKDSQQVKVLQTMLRDLNLESRIVACPIVREADGLAMSSRNSYLDPAQRQRALCLSQAIKLVQQATASGEREATKLQQIAEEHCSQYGQVDYIQIVDSENLQPLKQVDSSSRIIMAVFIDRVRLIDNAALGE
jgi:pantoate--beta-alanine ligase